MYADDKTVYTSAQTAVEMTAILKEELENYRLLDFRKQVMVDITWIKHIQKSLVQVIFTGWTGA